MLALLLILSFSVVFLHSVRLAIIVGIAAAIGYYSLALFSPIMTVIAVIFAIGFGAFVLLYGQKLLFLIAAVAAVVYATVEAGDPLLAVSASVPLLAAVVLAVSIRRAMRRSSSICLIAAVLLIGYLAVPVWSMWQAGLFSQSFLTEFIAELKVTYLEAFNQSLALVDEELRAGMTEEYFLAVFNGVLRMIPALAILAASVIGFLANRLFLGLCIGSGRIQKLPEASRFLILSSVSAIVYLISLLLVITVPSISDKQELLVETANNLVILLLPPLFLVGCTGLLGFFAKRGCLTIWFFVGVGMIFSYFPGPILYIISLFGVYLTFRANRMMSQTPKE